MDQAQLYQTQISFTEWFEKIKHAQTEEMRQEDNLKRDRLQVLHDSIQLPYDKPVAFPALEIAQRSPRFQSFLKDHGSEQCALRLIPLQQNLPKLRLRGKTVADVLSWFAQQKINPSQYKADFVPHAEDYLWSTIFIVHAQGVIGEVIKGGHYQLTQGFYEEEKPIPFSYDFSHWAIQGQEPVDHLKGLLKRLKVTDHDIQHLLREKLQATFAQDHLCGYFETVFSLDQGLWFVDYNRLLGKRYEAFSIVRGAGELSGYVAHPGVAQGKVTIILDPSAKFQEGDILVCDMTTPEYVPLMQKAAAIITERGGILSHAAIIARELGKPCIVGVTNAMRLLKEGEKVIVDARQGIIRRL